MLQVKEELVAGRHLDTHASVLILAGEPCQTSESSFTAQQSERELQLRQEGLGLELSHILRSMDSLVLALQASEGNPAMAAAGADAAAAAGGPGLQPGRQTSDTPATTNNKGSLLHLSGTSSVRCSFSSGQWSLSSSCSEGSHYSERDTH